MTGAARSLPPFKVLCYIVEDIVFFPCSRDYIHFRHTGQFLRTDLGVTAGYRYYGGRVQSLHSPDVLSGFAVCQVCHGTCIDYINISESSFVHRLKSGFRKLLTHCFCFILVDFASESMKSYLHVKSRQSRLLLRYYVHFTIFQRVYKVPLHSLYYLIEYP